MHNLQTVGNNGGSIFEHLLTKVHEVLKQCSAPFAVSSEKESVLGHPNF